MMVLLSQAGDVEFKSPHYKSPNAAWHCPCVLMFRFKAENYADKAINNNQHSPTQSYYVMFTPSFTWVLFFLVLFYIYRLKEPFSLSARL